MAVYQKRQQTIFSTIRSEGAILPMDLLQRISDPQNTQLDGLTPDAYHLPTIKLNEAINQAWTNLLGSWQRFKREQGRISAHESGTTLTRERWLLPLFNELGYGRLPSARTLMVGERSYSISHSWQHTPIHLISYKVDLDRSVYGENGARRSSPQSLLQELLNRSIEHLWGIVSNGLKLRILRNNISLKNQAYVEFDLEAMFNNEIYADFVLFWLLCHQSRVESERPEQCWLEKWSREAHSSGTRVLDDLRKNVEQAISELGSGFLSHPDNNQLREKLRTGTLSAMDYYNQLLRMVYRLLVLFVAEDRGILFDPSSLPSAQDLYNQYYSTAKLRYQADRQLGTRHSDLYYGLKLIMEKLSSDGGCPELGLPGLNGFLFSPEAVDDLNDCQLANYALLATVRHLAYTTSGQTRRIIDYKNLGSEELGSVYESLLELHPIFHLETGKFELASASGNQRKTTGSYYTPTSLITSLLDSALDPVLEEATNKSTAREAEVAILNLKICDPACGSGHFLVAASHRVAKRLAAVRTGEEEPDPNARRTALRDVVSHCIYGVDINPMAVELCKVSLWMEAIEPGKPLSFLDAHIQQGNSLLGTTPALLKMGIPDEAFEPIGDDDKKVCSDFKKLNKKFREGNRTIRIGEGNVFGYHPTLRAEMINIDNIYDDTVKDVRDKKNLYDQHQKSDAYKHSKIWADAWCAAFVWKKVKDFQYPFTEDDFRALEEKIDNIDEKQRNEIQRLAEQYQFFHWHLAFPSVFCVPRKDELPRNAQLGWSGGFDVMLGNPPWEHTELKEREWFVTRSPEIAKAAGADRKYKIESLVSSNPAIYESFLLAKRQQDGWSHIVRHSQRYPLCGRGRINMYALFSEINRSLLNTKGRVGCIVQSGIATDDTTKDFFQDLIDSHTLVSLFDFRNEMKLFPAIDHQVKITLLTIAGIDALIEKADFAFGLYTVDDLSIDARHFSLSADEIALLNPNTHTCPTFRSKRDMNLTKSIYASLPILINENLPKTNHWNITLRQGIYNMTSDSHLFCTRAQLEESGWHLEGNIFQKDDEICLPLYEGKMVGIFDHRFGTYEGREQSNRELGELVHSDPFALPSSRYWIHSSHLPPLLKDGRNAFLVSRIIARSTDARTSIFSLLPAIPCGNSLAVFIITSSSTREQLWLVSCSSSFIFDYVVRQKLGGPNLNFFILKQLAVPSPDSYTKSCQWNVQVSMGDWLFLRSLELIYTAWDLDAFAKDCGYMGSPFKWDEERRFLLRCELDAAYFHLYGIARDDVDYIMETFPIVKRDDEKRHSEYRTKCVILKIYDEMQRAIETGVTYQTRLDPPPADPAVAHPSRGEEN